MARTDSEQLEKEVAALDELIASVQRSLDVKLLPDAGRAKVEAAARAERRRLDALPMRITRGDGSQFDRYPNGREVEVIEAVEGVEAGCPSPLERGVSP